MLFRSGEAFSIFPYRVIFQYSATQSNPAIIKVGFSVPSKRFKRAADRNRIKRQMRETYRLQKKQLADLIQEQHLEVNIFFIYTGKKLPEHSFLYKRTGIALNKLKKSLLNEKVSSINEKDK